MSVRLCAVLPTYDNPITVGAVARALAPHVEKVIVVDDGSHEDGRRAVEALAGEPWAHTVHHPQNRGKGAACKTGFREAQALGFTHALQVDADGQHDLEAAPRFVARALEHPDALILGYPVYDDTLHKGRYAARLVTRFWNTIETLGPKLTDTMCGFRVYPLAAALASGTRGDRMDFDIEIPVRLVWDGVPVVNEPVGVRYLAPEEGGVSHYRTLADTAQISWLHTKLCVLGLGRLVGWVLRGGRPRLEHRR